MPGVFHYTNNFHRVSLTIKSFAPWYLFFNWIYDYVI